MSGAAPQHISSRDNPLLKQLRRLAGAGDAYRSAGQVWLEGEHLCQAALASGLKPAIAAFSETYWAAQRTRYSDAAIKNIVMPDRLFDSISGLGSPAGFGFIIDIPRGEALAPGAATVVLDRIQDPGNVGSILRSAAAFGFAQVLALAGTAALWSPKVLRSAMGAHFALHLFEELPAASLDVLAVPLVATSSHAGHALDAAELPSPCAWIFGHEGGGVADELQARATLLVRIDQPGGQESLNVAAAAAICLHASRR